MHVSLPPELRGPVKLALARAEESIPSGSALPGGSMYELKWDGYRVAVVRGEREARIWSRQGKDLTATFPDLAASAAQQIPAGTVVDGEAVVWHDDRLDFDMLQARMVNAPRKVLTLAARHPATLMAFDLLALDGSDLRSRPLRTRRRTLERLGADWAPPLQLSPVTTVESVAREWFTAYRAAGIEGLVVKGASGKYVPGRRVWVKVKSRESIDVLVGGVTGSVQRPDTVVAGLVRDGVLTIVGRTSTLTPHQSRELGALLIPAGPEHPWPAEISSSRFGSGRDTVPLVRVDPDVVAEVLADAALQAGAFRHPLRFVRPRLDMSPEDLLPAQ